MFDSSDSYDSAATPLHTDRILEYIQSSQAGTRCEHHDLAADHPELVAELVAEWETNWR